MFFRDRRLKLRTQTQTLTLLPQGTVQAATMSRRKPAPIAAPPRLLSGGVVLQDPRSVHPPFLRSRHVALNQPLISLSVILFFSLCATRAGSEAGRRRERSWESTRGAPRTEGKERGPAEAAELAELAVARWGGKCCCTDRIGRSSERKRKLRSC